MVSVKMFQPLAALLKAVVIMYKKKYLRLVQARPFTTQIRATRVIDFARTDRFILFLKRIAAQAAMRLLFYC